MMRIKKRITPLCAFLLFFSLLPFAAPVHAAGGNPKIAVVATLFPQYDFARQIAGGRADVSLLLAPGVESHSYEPAPADMIAIGRADLFLYTGDNMEHWAGRILAGLTGEKKPVVVDVSKGVTLSREGHTHAHDTHMGHEAHAHAYDPHIWTDPNNALTMASNVLAGLIAVDPDHAAYYRENAKHYFEELKTLDRDVKEAAASGVRREVVLGGRNAFHYFFKRYGIHAIAAYDSCAADSEPSVKMLASLVRDMKQKGIPVVYYEEMQVPRVARMLSEETGAKMLLLHSCHNISKAERDAGETYLSLMRRNLDNLKEGLR